MFPWWLQPVSGALFGAGLTILCMMLLVRHRRRMDRAQMREVIDEYYRHLHDAWRQNDTAVNWRSALVGAGALMYNLYPGMSRAERRHIARQAADNHITNRRVARVQMPQEITPETAEHHV